MSRVSQLSEGAEPWDYLAELLEEGDSVVIRAYISELDPGEIPRLLSRLGAEEHGALMQALAPAESAILLGHLATAHVADILRGLDSEQSAQIVGAICGFFFVLSFASAMLPLLQ